MKVCEFWQIRYTPVGEYLRLLILRRLARGLAEVEEIDRMVEEAVRRLHVRYDWRVWPRLLEGEVEIRGGVVTITPRGRWILEQTGKEVAKYVPLSRCKRRRAGPAAVPHCR